MQKCRPEELAKPKSEERRKTNEAQPKKNWRVYQASMSRNRTSRNRNRKTEKPTASGLERAEQHLRQPQGTASSPWPTMHVTELSRNGHQKIDIEWTQDIHDHRPLGELDARRNHTLRVGGTDTTGCCCAMKSLANRDRNLPKNIGLKKVLL